MKVCEREKPAATQKKTSAKKLQGRNSGPKMKKRNFEKKKTRWFKGGQHKKKFAPRRKGRQRKHTKSNKEKTG